MPTTLYITRHGQTEWNVQKRTQGHKDSPLTELGTQQAAWLGESLADVHIDAMYCSPSGRTVHTAQLIRGHREFPISTHDDLREIHMGDWEGLTKDEIESRDPIQSRIFDEQPHRYIPINGGETFFEVQRRAVACIEHIVGKHTNETVMVVTHGITLKSLMAHFENRPMDRFWDPPYIHPTCLCKIVVDEGGTCSVEMHGDVSHLQIAPKP